MDDDKKEKLQIKIRVSVSHRLELFCNPAIVLFKESKMVQSWWCGMPIVGELVNKIGLDRRLAGKGT